MPSKNRVDRILDVLDGHGRQRTHEPTIAISDDDNCWRCFAQPVDDLGLCPACRSWLRGERDTDPAEASDEPMYPPRVYDPLGLSWSVETRIERNPETGDTTLHAEAVAPPGTTMATARAVVERVRAQMRGILEVCLRPLGVTGDLPEPTIRLNGQIVDPPVDVRDGQVHHVAVDDTGTYVDGERIEGHVGRVHPGIGVEIGPPWPLHELRRATDDGEGDIS